MSKDKVMAQKDGAHVDRRGFLKTLGGGAAGVAAASSAVISSPVEAAENASDKRKKRYRETDHVKAFYRTNRY